MNQRSVSLILTVLLLAHFPTSYADDCMVSVNPPRIVENYPNVLKDKLDQDEGLYTASLENGDQIEVKFGRCELSLQGRYLSQSSDGLVTTTQQFLMHMIPSKGQADEVVQRFREKGALKFNEPLVIDGINDQHEVTVKEVYDPNFTVEIYYEWIPPLN